MGAYSQGGGVGLGGVRVDGNTEVKRVKIEKIGEGGGSGRGGGVRVGGGQGGCEWREVVKLL